METNMYKPQGLPVELDLAQRVLFQKDEKEEVRHRARLSPMEFSLFYALLRSYDLPGSYILTNDAERATGASIEHIRSVILRNVNIKLVPFSLEVIELPDNKFTLRSLSEKK